MVNCIKNNDGVWVLAENKKNNPYIHKFMCGFEGTEDEHSDFCQMNGWVCIEDGFKKYHDIDNETMKAQFEARANEIKNKGV